MIESIELIQNIPKKINEIKRFPEKVNEIEGFPKNQHRGELGTFVQKLVKSRVLLYSLTEGKNVE